MLFCVMLCLAIINWFQSNADLNGTKVTKCNRVRQPEKAMMEINRTEGEKAGHDGAAGDLN